MSRRHLLVLRLAVGPLAAVALALLAWFFQKKGLDGLDKVASVVGAIVGTLALWVAVLPPAGLRRRAPDTARPDEAEVQALDTLAEAVRRVWEPEERHRRLLNPHPLPTAWVTIGPPVADHWANVRADGVNEPLDLDGVVDHDHPDALCQIVADPRLRGRLVVLGEPGAGKTALLLRLTLTLLRSRTSGERVPVLLRLSTWEPFEQNLARWVTERLRADYGGRRRGSPGGLLPVLDGLDEMPAESRRQALHAINAAFKPTDPLVLTSRTEDYLDTLTAINENVLAAATVLELAPLPADVVGGYLTRAAPPAQTEVWSTLFARDQADNDGHLAAALSEALWVDLTRATYADPYQPTANPTELLDLSDTDTIHGHLLDRLIPAAYPEPPEPSPDQHIWHRGDAQRWLRFLAARMDDSGTQDLAWWELVNAVPRRIRLTIGLTCGLVGWLPLGIWTGPMSESGRLLPGLVLWLIVGTAFGLAFGSTRPVPSPPIRIRFRPSNLPLVLRLGRAVALGATCSATVGLGFGVGGGGTGAGFAVGVGALGVGVPVGLAFEFLTLPRLLLESLDALDRDADVAAAVDPAGVLHDGRNRVAFFGLAGLALGLLVGLAATLTTFLPFWAAPSGWSDHSSPGPGTFLAFGPTFGLACGLAFGLLHSAWAHFLLARPWLASRGRLPWRLMAFLADAHRRGVLRQAGGVYQFRHALLRDRLAATGDLELNAKAVADLRRHGASPHETARVRFKDYGPLIRLGRLDDADRLLRDCHDTFQTAEDTLQLGKVFDARSNVEYARGHYHEAVALERTALRLLYAQPEPWDVTVSHHNIALALRRSGTDPAEQLAHRLAAALLCQLAGETHYRDRTLRVLAYELRGDATAPAISQVSGALPTTLAEVTALVDTGDGVRFGALVSSLAPGSVAADVVLRDLYATALDQAAYLDANPGLRELTIAVVAAATAGAVPDELAAQLDELAGRTDWAKLVTALRGVLAGERDPEQLTAGLAEFDAAILTAILFRLPAEPERNE